MGNRLLASEKSDAIKHKLEERRFNLVILDSVI